MKRVKILWTGGFDSTFRISQLSRMNIEIQPFYVYNSDRQSRQYELNAISEITEMFKGLDQTKAKFLPLEVITKEECGEEEAVSQARKNISKTNFIGTQYVFLCGFSRKYPGVELSVHDNVIDILSGYGGLIKIHDDVIGDYYVVDETKTPEDLVLIFKDFHFPLVNYTKKKMMDEYEEYGLTEIMNKTWFCHSPIDDKPCGECNPCKYTIEEGLYNRFDKRALFRYVLRKLRIKLIYKHSKKFLKTTKREIKRYLKRFKKDLKKYAKLLKKDLKKYRKHLEKTHKIYVKFFRKFRAEWKN